MIIIIDSHSRFTGLTVRVVSTKPYKNDNKNRDSLVRSMMRKDIVRHLRYGKAGLSTKLKVALHYKTDD